MLPEHRDHKLRISTRHDAHKPYIRPSVVALAGLVECLVAHDLRSASLPGEIDTFEVCRTSRMEVSRLCHLRHAVGDGLPVIWVDGQSGIACSGQILVQIFADPGGKLTRSDPVRPHELPFGSDTADNPCHLQRRGGNGTLADCNV